MDLMKMETEVDPLAILSSDNTDTDEKKPLAEEENILDLHVAEIKIECVDHSCDLTLETKIEETVVPSNFVTTDCKPEEKFCDVDKVKDEHKLEVTAEENEILINRVR
ncbi:uncharacterized protein [Periplaneta americana]|uniref:uncharacterized protein isoform X2 n=1 Tax=Periplaneta americana TaxID=6978 RepID=UPI0037E8806A